MLLQPTISCESRNTENVILQRDITKENCIKYIIASSKWTRVIWLIFTYLRCYRHTAMRVRNNDSWHRRPAKCAWCKLGLALNRTLSTLRFISGVTIWHHVCVLVAVSWNTRSRIIVHLYDSSEHFMKLSMQFDAFNSTFIVTTTRAQQ